jgi:signal transduction histidine kinase
MSQRRKINRCIIWICLQNDEGKVLGIVIVARDVTKQKQAIYSKYT